MAYQRPSPRSPYGDELMDDGSTTSLAGQPQQQAYGYQQESKNILARDVRNQGLVNQATPQGRIPPVDSISQEDILFMRGWQRDSFYKRVLPLASLSCGALFMYNKHNQLPHKVGRYSIVLFSAFLLGKWSYYPEFKKRLAVNKSNSPYMIALKKYYGMNPPSDDGGFSGDSDASHDYGLLAGNDSTNWNSAGLVGDMNLGSTGSPTQSPPYKQPGSELGYSAPLTTTNADNSLNETPRQETTYAELRARNRGIIK